MSDAGASSASPPTKHAITRSEWALILVLVAIQFTHMVDFVIIMPLGGRLMSELNITTVQFGWIVAAYALAAGLASLAASFVMDRFDRRSVLLAMYAGFGLSTLYCGLADSYESLLVARTLAGAFGGTSAVAILAVIGDVFPPEKRGRASGAVMSAFALGSVIGLPIGLKLAGWYGRGAPFLALAALSAIVFVIGWVRLPYIRGHITHTRANRWAEFVAVVRKPAHLWAFVFTFFLVLGTFTVASFVGPYFSSTNGWTEDDLSTIYLFAGLFTLVGMNVVGRLADQMPRLPLFRVLAGVAVAVTLIVTNLPPGPLWVATIALSAFMVFAAGRMVPAQTMLLGTAAPQVRGAFMSLNTAVQHLATGVAPMIAGGVVANVDGKITRFPIVGVIAALCAVVSIVLAGRLTRAEAPAVIAASPQPETAAA